MDDESVIEIMAGSTAIIFEICTIFLENNIIEKDILLKRLYKLDLAAAGVKSNASAPIRHLIDLIERQSR